MEHTLPGCVAIVAGPALQQENVESTGSITRLPSKAQRAAEGTSREMTPKRSSRSAGPIYNNAAQISNQPFRICLNPVAAAKPAARSPGLKPSGAARRPSRSFRHSAVGISAGLTARE